MQVTATSGSIAAASTAGSSPSQTLNYDAFLQLLIAQMKNQDPTKPMDASQQIAQLATFSGVEQAIKTNAKLDALISSVSLTQAEGLLGRTVTSSDGSVTGQVVSVRVVSDGAVAVLGSGKEVRIEPGITVS
jgi:flagellar basal-body rod modification protein FlgD